MQVVLEVLCTNSLKEGIWSLSSRCVVGFFNHLFLSRHVWPATVLFLWVDIENNFSSCFAFRWIPTNIRSYSYMEVWHGHFRIGGIILIAVHELPCTLRERIFCSEVQKRFCIPCIFLSCLAKDRHYHVWEHPALSAIHACSGSTSSHAGVNHDRLNDM